MFRVRANVAQARIVGGYLAVAGIAFAGYFMLDEPAATAAYLVLGALPIAAIALGTRLFSPAAMGPWLLLAAGQAAFLLADATWYAAYLPTGEAPPTPSISDVLYLAGYPLLALGVVLFIRARQPRYRLTAALDALVVGVAAVLVLWLGVIDGFIHDESVAQLERAVLLAYQIGDVLILSAAAYLLLSGRQAKGAFYLLVGSIAALLVADVTYVVVADEELAANVSDAFWLASYVLFGLTALMPSMRNLTEPSDAPTAPEGTGRLVLLAAAISIVPGFAIYQRFVIGHEDLALTGVGAVIVMAAILLRMRELVAVHRRTEGLYASLLANASDAFAILRPDGRFAYVSPASVRVLGYEADQIVGRSAIEFVHPKAVRDAVGVLRRVSTRPGSQQEADLRVQRADGQWRWLSVVATNRTDDPLVNGIVLNYRDVTERHDNQRRLDLQARVLDEVQHAVMVIDTGGAVSYWNGAAEKLFGWRQADALGQPLESLDLLLTSEQTGALLAGLGDGSRASGEYEFRRRDGSTLTAIVTSAPTQGAGGRLRGVIISAVDITDRKRLEGRLTQQAFTDGLTGLANRALFLDRVEHLLARRSRVDGPLELAVLFIDLDDFKTVNDSMGHRAGDELLVTLARRLADVLRPTDTAARLGGDEFAILLEDTSALEAERVAQRLLVEIGRPVRLPEREIQVSASVGVATDTADRSISAEDLLRNADLAMYRAKTQQHGSYAVYQPGMYEAALRRLQLKADLQRALDSDALTLEYQPIVRLADGMAVGAEALLRWTHPEQGPVSAAETLALADSAGLLVALGTWVFEHACSEARRWREELSTADQASDVFVSVNASARELLDPGFADVIAATLTRNRLPAQALAIEITESDLMQDSIGAIAALRRLKELGVRLAIDDFGTGYSSLAYLEQFPIDILKVDRTFVSSRSTVHDGAIARAIIELARSLGIEVVAEGIERADEAELMVRLGAQYGQGYYLGRPTDGAAALSMLARRTSPRRRRRASSRQRLAPSSSGA